MYERAGKKTRLCTDLGRHNDDKSLALKHYGNWLISMAESGHQSLQSQLLLLLTQTILNNGTHKNAGQLETDMNEVPSALYVKAALKIEESNLKI